MPTKARVWWRLALVCVVLAVGCSSGEDPSKRVQRDTPADTDEADDPNADPLGEILEPNSPLLVGVETLTANTHCDGTPVGDAKVVAKFATSGDPIVVRGMVKGRSRVDINIYPLKSTYEGNGVELIRNALFYQ